MEGVIGAVLGVVVVIVELQKGSGLSMWHEISERKAVTEQLHVIYDTGRPSNDLND